MKKNVIAGLGEIGKPIFQLVTRTDGIGPNFELLDLISPQISSVGSEHSTDTNPIENIITSEIKKTSLFAFP